MKVKRKMIFDAEARAKLKAGIDKMAMAVGSTLGPKGRNVIFEREFNIPVVTNDGVTIAREIVLEDDYERIGAELLREAASKTNDVAGDGTTTSVVVAHELLNQAFLKIEAGENPMDLKRQLEVELAKLLEELSKYKIKIDTDEMITQVATISANNDRQIGEAIMKAVKEVGRDGVITVEEKYGQGVDMEVQKGFQINSGIVHPWFATNADRLEAEVKNVPVICVQFKVTSFTDIKAFLIAMTQRRLNQVVLVAPEISYEALNVLLEARKSGEFHCVAIKAPYVNERQLEYIEDIAIYCGAEVLGPNATMAELKDDNFGEARRVISSRKFTTFVEGDGDQEKIQSRIASIKSQFDSVESEFDVEKLKERVSKLSGGVAVLKVGAMTEPEMKEKKYRIEDAIQATQAALDEGVVIGGGMTFLHLKDSSVSLGNSALGAVFGRICDNAGVDIEEVWEKIIATRATRPELEINNIGYNALTGDIEDLLRSGVIDPYKVVKAALENAFSVAMMILSTGTLVAFSEDPAKARIM